MKKQSHLVLLFILTVTLLAACQQAGQPPSKQDTKEAAYEQWVQSYMDELNKAYENMTDQFISDGHGKIQTNKKLTEATKAFDRVIQKGLDHQEVPAAYQKADQQLKTGLASFEKGISKVEKLLKHPDQEKLFISATHHFQDGLQQTAAFIEEVGQIQQSS
ncbi:hypothetical protein ABEX69_06710 [Bacillus safensis]|uniref:hypothetical protein n=1 Tax=Bacillus TaxID=1386 RepID=UPI000CCC61AD|nr:hypothetical protein [Bacillus]PNU23765.1 hypothetical protein C1954_08830 [Bacillus stratosphericus]MBR0614320.1 hypothetical protein [Bacillus safensis]MBR0634733.1 hypothetical protein [Bacillus safensis]MCW4642874.1 hypothetical protein [Bacillus safensis]MCY7563789.1 hypothetical protein [Bacillus safensis]